MADEDKDNLVGQNDALSFFSRSGLTVETLGSVWNQVNPQGAATLSADQFVYACQLIAMGQSGAAPDLHQLQGIIAQGHEIPVPSFSGINVGAPSLAGPTTLPASPSLVSSGSGLVWATNENLHNWMTYFNDQDLDKDGYVSGNDVFQFFSMSGVPQATLGVIWGLADVNGDGKLDGQEFCAAMALIAGLNEGKQLPSSLPSSLVQLIWPTGLPLSSGLPPPPVDGMWSIPEVDKQQDSATFQQSAIGGFLEGNAAVSLFGQSGVSVNELAVIYGLADLDGDGRLNQTEFFIAMKLIRMRMTGTPIPNTLPPELRNSALGGSSSGFAGGAVGGGVVGVLEQRIAELQSKLATAEQSISSLQIQVNSLKGERDQALLQKQDAESRAAQAQAQAAALGSQSQQHTSQAMARISELAAQLDGNQAKMQEMHAYNSQLEAQLQQQAQQLQAARQQADQFAHLQAQQAAQAQARPVGAGNPFGGSPYGQSGNPFGAPVNPFG